MMKNIKTGQQKAMILQK